MKKKFYKSLIINFLFVFSINFAFAQSKIREVEISLNKGNRYTNTTTVAISLKASRAKEMMVSNDKSFAGAVWQAFKTEEEAWVLPDQDASHTVYVKLKDEEGAESMVYTRSVTLDREAPKECSVKIIPNGSTKQNKKVALSLSAKSGVFMMISNDENFYGSKWESFRTSVREWTLSGNEDGIKKVYAKFRDQAGNESAVFKDMYKMDSNPPIRGSVVIEGNKEYSANPDRIVKLKITALGAARMQIANDEAFTDTTSWLVFMENYDWVLSEGQGKKKVFVKFKDVDGNVSQAVFDEIIYDNEPPSEGKIVIDKGAETTKNRDNIVNLSIQAKDAELMLVSNRLDFAGARWQLFQKELKWTMMAGEGKRTVYVKFKDKYENESGVYSADIWANYEK